MGWSCCIMGTLSPIVDDGGVDGNNSFGILDGW